MPFRDQIAGQPTVFLLLEEWQSRIHHEGYIQFISGNGVMAELLAFMQGPPEVKYYAKLPL